MESQLQKLRKILKDPCSTYKEIEDARESIFRILNKQEKLTDGECTPERIDNLNTNRRLSNGNTK